MINNRPFVSVVIACRNEEKFISKCLDSLLLQDYPKENTEILVADGESEDGTRDVIRTYTDKNPFVKLLENPQKFTPFGLNIGIKEAKGEIIIRIDAHSTCEKDYISKCVRYLEEYKVDNVGGVIETLPGKNTIIAKAIALSLSYPFGVGKAYFRIGSKKPREVDTVFGGCYKKEIFEKIGYFNENLPRGQDMELNLRLKRFGGKILLVPEIRSSYYARSDFKSFWNHSVMDGINLIYPLKFGIVIFSWRHLVPLAFVLSLIAFGLLAFFSLKFLWFIASYLLISLYFSAILAFTKKDFRYLFLIPVAFAILHIGYGLGSVYGLLKLLKNILSRR